MGVQFQLSRGRLLRKTWLKVTPSRRLGSCWIPSTRPSSACGGVTLSFFGPRIRCSMYDVCTTRLVRMANSLSNVSSMCSTNLGTPSCKQEHQPSKRTWRRLQREIVQRQQAGRVAKRAVPSRCLNYSAFYTMSSCRTRLRNGQSLLTPSRRYWPCRQNQVPTDSRSWRLWCYL